jgi:hypothetical protein
MRDRRNCPLCGGGWYISFAFPTCFPIGGGARVACKYIHECSHVYERKVRDVYDITIPRKGGVDNSDIFSIIFPILRGEDGVERKGKIRIARAILDNFCTSIKLRHRKGALTNHPGRIYWKHSGATHANMTICKPTFSVRENPSRMGVHH